MEIRKLTKISEQELKSLGDFGYISNQKYSVSRELSMNSFSIRLDLIDLESPYIKEDMNNEEDLHKYQSYIDMGYSIGLFKDNELVALAISEPQKWNNTIMLWHLQVHQKYRRNKYGKKLINELFMIAQENGFRAVTLETQNTNTEAIHFYLNCGFTFEGIDLSLYAMEAREEAAVFMRKHFE